MGLRGEEPNPARESAAFVWGDRALFVGDRSETTTHAHHATEICVALDLAGIDMSEPGGVAFEGVAGALVRASASHRLSIPGPKVAVLYFEPQSPTGAALHAALGEGNIASLPTAKMAGRREALAQLLADGSSGLTQARAACDGVLDALIGAVDRPPPMDWRVKRARAILDASLEDAPGLEALAAQVNLSGSRLRHLFKAQVGLPIRRYVLWMRLRVALLRALDGGSMTSAAHEAGFADAAHFTRTCRQMFGLPPTAFTPVQDLFVDMDG